jgi:hypothetical protein
LLSTLAGFLKDADKFYNKSHNLFLTLVCKVIFKQINFYTVDKSNNNKCLIKIKNYEKTKFFLGS